MTAVAGDGSGGEGGYVEVRAFFHLAGLIGGQGPWQISLSELQGVAAPGAAVTVSNLATHLGIGCEPLGMAMVNGSKAELDAVLQPGDRVAFFPEYIPYHRVYGACVV